MTLTSGPVLNDLCFNKLAIKVHDLTGITIKPERRAMLEGRLLRRLRALKLPDFEAYLQHVNATPDEHEAFVNTVTTNETYFYRTPRIWDYISNDFLNNWYAQNKGKTLNIWSAASSTGEEAHTIGVLMQAFKDVNAGFDYRITGTDIDSSVIQKASTGLYNGRSIERFRKEKPELFARYMVGSDVDGYKVAKNIKQNIQFKYLNLFKPTSTDPSYSLILLRNVLIYFTKEDQELVLRAAHKRLNQTGVLIIGESESLNNLSSEFITITPTIYQRSDAITGAKAA